MPCAFMWECLGGISVGFVFGVRSLPLKFMMYHSLKALGKIVKVFFMCVDGVVMFIMHVLSE